MCVVSKHTKKAVSGCPSVSPSVKPSVGKSVSLSVSLPVSLSVSHVWREEEEEKKFKSDIHYPFFYFLKLFSTGELILFYRYNIRGESVYIWPVLPQLGVFVRRGYLTEHRVVHSERKCTELHENTRWQILLRCK